MDIASDTNSRSAAVDLAQDTVCVRPVDRSDTDALVALHHRLSPRTLRCRYLTTHPDLSAERIGRFADVDGHDRVGLVAVVDGRLAGLARYARRGDTDDALVTLVVDDSVRDLDLEVVLLQHLATVARREGMRRLLVRVSPIDRRLIERLDDSPFDVSRHYHAGTVTITLRLDPYA
jgi:GNAT superfamily N-acetyltransferase